MKCLTVTESETHSGAVATEVRLPMGLLGFEQIKDYLLIANPEEDPFMWLQVKGNASLAFIVINPFLVEPAYLPDLPQVDVDFLGIKEPQDALLFNIVTLHPGGHATVNLKGPLVINRYTLVGKQVVLANSAIYSVDHRLPVAESAA
jgi:flagellar assembly factor FliW